MSIESLWQELRNASGHPAYRRVDEQHPLDLYAGIGPSNDALLMLVCDQNLGTLPSYNSLKVDVGRREDGRVAYSLSLQDTNLEPLFAQLCTDLIESSRSVARERAAGFFAKRLDRWRRLLAAGRVGLTEEEARGLLGELYVLARYISPRHNIQTAVRSWVGPQGQEQDFRIDATAFEVKTIEPGKQHIQVSSLGQLDGAGCELILLVVSASVAMQGEASLTIEEMVREIDKGIEPDQPLADIFTGSLLAVGYLAGDPAGLRPYRMSKLRSYRVEDNFPRLRLSAVPLGVIEAKYTIDLSRCVPFEVSEDSDAD
jgi:hypothetical protein